jgi:hypothetical protein
MIFKKYAAAIPESLEFPRCIRRPEQAILCAMQGYLMLFSIDGFLY